jgi:hypothetical protein
MRRSSSPNEPVLITTAAESGDIEYERRRKKYAIMMATRAIFIVAAALTYRASIWLALALVVGGMILPWCAVIIANDRPARKHRSNLSYRADLHRERALPPGTDDRTVDG